MIAELNIHHLRNISEAKLSLHPRFNFFSGPNGSGKTSILEALYLLSAGYSFRTREITPLVQSGQNHLTVYAKTRAGDTISVQKFNAGSTLVRRNLQACARASDLALSLPCQVFYQDLFQIMDAGPSSRRAVLDWGVFHVKPSYHDLWKNYRQVLKQRNALLRQKADRAAFVPWDKLLDELSQELHQLRFDYFSQWSPRFQALLRQLTDKTCDIHYEKGWDKKQRGTPLKTILTEQFAQDMQAQYTHSGAHQADIGFDSGPIKAKQHLSRGQQKIILIALKLSQAQLLSSDCVYLMDDISLELDSAHVQRLFACLNQVPGQFFLTAAQALSESAYPIDFERQEFFLNEGNHSLIRNGVE